MKTGKLDSNAAVPDGEFPFFTCAQETYRINIAAYDTEAVLLGGNNAAGIFPLKYYNGPFNAYQRTYILESLDSSKLSTRFLYYALKPALSLFQSASIGAATQYLTKPILENFQISLPSIESQNKIVSILSVYDDLIENNRRRIQLLEEAARLLYQEWFVRLRFPGHEHAKIVDGVPEGWDQQQIRSICPEIRTGVDPASLDPKTPYIGLEHIPRRSISLSSWSNVEEVNSRKYRYQEGDILFGKIRPYFHKVGIAFNSGVTSSDSIILRPISFLYHPFLLMMVSSDGFVSEVSKTMKEGTKMPRADWKFIEQKKISIPPDPLLSAFNTYIEPIISQLKTLSLCNIQLQEARDLLLPRLMNGVIPV